MNSALKGRIKQAKKNTKIGKKLVKKTRVLRKGGKKFTKGHARNLKRA